MAADGIMTAFATNPRSPSKMRKRVSLSRGARPALLRPDRRGPQVAGLPEDAPTDQVAVALAKTIRSLPLLDYECVGDAAGHPVPPIPKTVAKGLILADEGNATTSLPNGISAGAKTRRMRKALPGLPRRSLPPPTLEACQVWELAQALHGQLRAILGAVVGWVMTAALGGMGTVTHNAGHRVANLSFQRQAIGVSLAGGIPP